MENNSLKILHIIPNLKKGGAERICIDICRSLADQGHVVKIILFEDSNEYIELSETIEIDVVEVSFKLYKTKQNENLQKSIEKFNPEIVNIHLYYADLIWKSVKLNIPSVTHLHGMYPQYNFPYKGLFSKITWITLLEFLWFKNQLKKIPTAFISISQETTSHLKKHIPKNTYFQLPNAIDYQKFYNSNERTFPINPIKIVSVGSLVPHKGQILLVDIIKYLNEFSGNKVECTLIGDGPEKENIIQYATNQKVNNQIVLKGKVSNPESYLSNANIYVHCAFSEPFGLVLLEAMASGLPVFTTDGKGNRDILEHKKNGFIYPKRNAKVIAKDILQLTQNQDAYNSMSIYAKEFSKQYDIKDYTRKLVHIYSDTIQLFTKS